MDMAPQAISLFSPFCMQGQMAAVTSMLVLVKTKICYVIIHAARRANLRAEQEGGVRLRGSQVSNLPFHFTALHSHRSQQSKKHTCTSGGSEVHHCPVAKRISSLVGQGDPNRLSPFVVLALAAWPSQGQEIYQVSMGAQKGALSFCMAGAGRSVRP